MCTSHSRRLWDAAAYDSYRNARLRPALDLLHGLLPFTKNAPANIWELGCGSGSMLPVLRHKFPQASIQAVDSSLNMLASARERTKGDAAQTNGRHPPITFHHAEMEEFVERVLSNSTPSQPHSSSTRPDLIYSNAAFHWMPYPVLKPFLLRLYKECLSPGGVLAFQIPDSRKQASHVEMEGVASRFSSLQKIRVPRSEVDMGEYYRLFATSAAAHGCGNNNISLWTTTYLHPIQSIQCRDGDGTATTASGRHPVVDFYASTGLGPFLEACSSEEEQAEFCSQYEQRMQACYPTEDGSAFLEVTRLFCTVQKPEPQE